MKSFWIRTFGCQMNEHDSLRMRQQLVAQGMIPVSDPIQADLVIINSCSVRAKPEHKAISEAGRYKRLKFSRGTRIMLAGCVAKQQGRQLIQKAPYLDAIIGPDQIHRISEIVGMVRLGQTPVIAVEEHDEQNPAFTPLGPAVDDKISAAVTIMKGCNNFCSYCIVPYVRGREISRPLKGILQEVEQLASRGCREVLLLGQNVNSYRDPEGAGFPDLLQALDRQGVIDRIRFTTSHPKDISKQLVETVATSSRVCEHVHLGLQSGSNRILGLMNRHYTQKEFLQKVEMFRQRVHEISITTDIIVGFPSETEDDFRQTLEAVEASGFDQAFSFKYSPRPGTEAANFEDDLNEETKAKRLTQLQSLLARLETESLTRLIGSTREVLIEGLSLRDKHAYTGRTRCNRVVNFLSNNPLEKGDQVPVHLSEVRGHTLWGHAGSSCESRFQEGVA